MSNQINYLALITLFCLGIVMSGNAVSQSMSCSISKIVSMSFHKLKIPNKNGDFSNRILTINENITVFTTSKNKVFVKTLHCPDKEQEFSEKSFDIVNQSDNEIYEIIRRKNNGRTETYFLNFASNYAMFSDLNHSIKLQGGSSVTGVMYCKSYQAELVDIRSLCP